MITTLKSTILSIGFLLLPFFVNGQSNNWIRLPKEEWPTIALTNHVQFKNGDRYIDPSFHYAGTGFLIDYGNKKYAITAKHVLWIARNKNHKSVIINNELARWTMKPKNAPKDSVTIDRLINEDSTEILEGAGSSILERDMIVFSIRSSSQTIRGLVPRFSDVKPGEKVYMIGNPYQEKETKIYETKVVRKLGTDILIELNSNMHIAGLSGSPGVDANGFAVGVLSSTASDTRSGKNVIVLTSMEYLRNVLEGKPELNKAKLDYGPLLLETVLKSGVMSAIHRYEKLASNPKNYYIYNLRSPTRNGLVETGKKLMEMNRLDDAIGILEFNVKVNPFYFQNYNVLAKAYREAGNKAKAIEAYHKSIEKVGDKDENEAFNELERLER